MAITTFHSKDVNFIESYNENVLTGNEAAPVYDATGWDTFIYQKVKTIKLKLIGSY